MEKSRITFHVTKNHGMLILTLVFSLEDVPSGRPRTPQSPIPSPTERYHTHHQVTLCKKA